MLILQCINHTATNTYSREGVYAFRSLRKILNSFHSNNIYAAFPAFMKIMNLLAASTFFQRASNNGGVFFSAEVTNRGILIGRIRFHSILVLHVPLLKVLR